MAKKYALLFMILLPLIIFSGCWSRREIEELAIVTALGIDKGPDGKIHLTAQIIKPGLLAKGAGGGGSGVSQKPFWNVEGDGQTIIEAFRALNLKSPRTLYFPHNQVLIFGEKLAREGLIPYLDRIARSIEVRRTMNLLVTQGEAHDIVTGELAIERIPAVGISGLIRHEIITSGAFAPTLRDFFQMLSLNGFNPVAGKIELTPETGNTGGQGEKENPKSLILKGMAIFKKDKLVGFYDPKETRGYLWTQGKVVRGIITILHKGQKVAFELTRSSADIKVKRQGDSYVADIKIKAESDLAEHEGPLEIRPEEVQIYDRGQSEAIRNEIVQAIDKAKEMKTDIFGFGEALHRRQPKEWQQVENMWNDDFFPNLKVNIDVTAKTRRRGMIVMPPPFSE